MNPTYLGDIDLNEDTLAHYGVLGMKWGKRKAKLKADLEWKKSKFKNKILELQTKKNRKKIGMRDADEISNKNGKRISIINSRPRDDGKATSRTSATGNFQYKIDGKKSQATLNEGYSKQPNPKSVEKTLKNYKDYDSESGTRKYTKPLKTNTSGQTTKWEPKTNSERVAKSNKSNIDKQKKRRSAPTTNTKGQKTKWAPETKEERKSYVLSNLRKDLPKGSTGNSLYKNIVLSTGYGRQNYNITESDHDKLAWKKERNKRYRTSRRWKEEGFR